MDMKNIAARMTSLQTRTEAEADKLAAAVKAGQMTADEAATKLMEATIVIRQEVKAPRAEQHIEFCRLLIDERLPGYKGLVLGRHV